LSSYTWASKQHERTTTPDDIKGLDKEYTPVKEPLFGIDIVAGDTLWFE
jgi:hypothetical protein